MKIYHNFILAMSLIAIITLTFFMTNSYINETVNTQYIVKYIMSIMFFIGVILFYHCYKNRKLLYMGYLFLLLCFFVSLIYLPITFKSKTITPVIYAICSTYVFYSINKYLYSIYDIRLIKLLSKILFFNLRGFNSPPLCGLNGGGAGYLFPRIRRSYKQKIFNTPRLCRGDFLLRK
jgi:hypothetical protein